jgi:hypothetical protein
MADHQGSLLVAARGSPVSFRLARQAHPRWLNTLLPLVSMEPPACEKWAGHSLRLGGASVSLAIGCEMFHIMHHDVWKSLARVQQYLSMMILPSAATCIFFGWMLPQGPSPPPQSLEINPHHLEID